MGLPLDLSVSVRWNEINGSVALSRYSISNIFIISVVSCSVCPLYVYSFSLCIHYLCVCVK